MIPCLFWVILLLLNMSWGKNSILVTGITFKDTQNEILAAFEDSGEPVQAYLRGPTSAYVVFTSPQHATLAIQLHDDKPLLDANATVKVISADTAEMNSELLLLQNMKTEPSPPAPMASQPLKSAVQHGSHLHNPIRISTFSGDCMKGEVSYDQFKREVRTLMRQGLPTDAILNALTRTLRGTAAEIILSIGDIETGAVEIEDLLIEFDCAFGNVLPPEALYETFFSAKQLEGERITVWSSRLKELLRRLQMSEQRMPDEIAKNVLRSKFWAGLQDQFIRTALRHKFENKEPYENLLVAARAAEMETSLSGPGKPSLPQQAKVQQTTVTSSLEQKMDKLLDKFSQVESRLTALEKSRPTPTNDTFSHGPQGHETDFRQQQQVNQPQPTPNSGRQPFCRYCRQPGHSKEECVRLNAKQSAPRGK